MKLVYECFVWFPLWAELRANVLAKQSSSLQPVSFGVFTLHFTPKLGLERVTLPSGLQTLAVSEFPQR